MWCDMLFVQDEPTRRELVPDMARCLHIGGTEQYISPDLWIGIVCATVLKYRPVF